MKRYQIYISSFFIVAVVLSTSELSHAVTFTFRNGLAINGQAYTGTSDATDNQASPNSAFGSAYWPLYIRGNGVGNQCTTLIKFSDLNTYIPAGFKVQSARVGLTAFNSVAGTIDVKVSEMLKPWNNSLLTWNIDGLGNNWVSGGALGAGTDRAVAVMSTVTITGGTVNVGDTVWFNLDPAVVQNWINNSSSNNGMVFFSNDGRANSFNVVGRIGAPAPYDVQRPQLEVTGVVVSGPVVLFRNGLAIDGQTYTGTSDATMNQGAPSGAYGNAYWPLYIRASGANNQCTTLIKFADLGSNVPAGFIVQSARVGLTGFNGVPGTISVQVAQMLKPWNNSSLTWTVDGLGNNWASGGALGAGTDHAATAMSTVTITGGTVNAGDTVWFNLDPAVVQGWINNNSSNNGMVFFSNDGQSNYFNVVGRIGTGGSYATQRPQLEITGKPECQDLWASGVGSPADLNHDCQVDMQDLATLVNSWLGCYDPNNPVCANFYELSEPVDYVIARGLPAVDGVINTAEWAAATWNQMDKVYDGDPCDLSGARWAALWDSTTNLIYVAVTGVDAVHFNTSSYQSSEGADGVEFYIDAGNTNTVDYYTDYSLAQQYIGGYNGSGGEWKVLGPGITVPAGAVVAFKASVVGSTYNYEVSLTPYQHLDMTTPASSQIMTLTSGKIIGLDVVMSTKTNTAGNFGMKCQNQKAGKFSDSTQFMNCKMQ